jgi:excinuclease UvrABC helicase subunit UvrB
MVEIGNVKEVIKDYIIKQLVSMGESSPAIRLLIPLAKRAITNNINSFDKFLKPIADKDGMIDIEGIFDEEMEIINNIDQKEYQLRVSKNELLQKLFLNMIKELDFEKAIEKRDEMKRLKNILLEV